MELQCLTDSGVFVNDWLFGEDCISVKTLGKSHEIGNGTLTIESFDASYAGLYRCVARVFDSSSEHRCVSRAATLYFNGPSELVGDGYIYSKVKLFVIH